MNCFLSAEITKQEWGVAWEYSVNSCHFPRFGGTHFYRKARHCQQAHVCVNALQRATLISTSLLEENVKDLARCQCPPTGHTHFYTFCIVLIWLFLSVNALQRATLISTWIKSEKSRVGKCVNALQRATLISTTGRLTMNLLTLLCQCPPTGHTHFYIAWSTKSPSSGRVSMPSNGPHSFLPKEDTIMFDKIGVSMPSNGPHSFLHC